MEEEVVEVVGAKGKHDPERVAVRHGHEAGEVTLGGRRVAVERPPVRSADGSSELPLATYRHFADRDLLSRLVLERMLAGISTRRYRRSQEPVGSKVERAARSTSKSAVSIAVDDIDAAVAGLRAHGGALLGEVESYEDIYRLCYVRGPEGIIVELAERIG
jgi:catechol 2,3-dioxygenase-like lactoylglutathione lyase family enzyme